MRTPRPPAAAQKKPVSELTDEELEAELKEAEKLADDTYDKWLEPVVKWLKMAADGKVTQEEFRAAFERGEIMPNTQVLADALYEAAAKPLRGIGGEHVEAAKRRKKHPEKMPDGKTCYTEGCSLDHTGNAKDKIGSTSNKGNSGGREKRTAATALQAVHSALDNPHESIPPLFIFNEISEEELKEFNAYKQAIHEAAQKGSISVSAKDARGRDINVKVTPGTCEDWDKNDDDGNERYAYLPNILKTVQAPDNPPKVDGNRLIYRKTFFISQKGKNREKAITYRVVVDKGGNMVTGMQESSKQAQKAKQKRK